MENSVTRDNANIGLTVRRNPFEWLWSIQDYYKYKPCTGTIITKPELGSDKRYWVWVRWINGNAHYYPINSLLLADKEILDL